jgi:hypothetical protein
VGIDQEHWEGESVNSNYHKKPVSQIGLRLIVIAFLVIPGGVVSAQSPEVQKVAKTAVEDATRPLRTASPVTAEATAAPSAERLKERLKQLERSMAELKQQLDEGEKPQKSSDAGAGAAGSPASGPPDASAGPRPVQGKKMENLFQVYGHVMLDAGYQFKTNSPDWFDVVRPTKLPSFKGEFAPDGKTFFGVRQTRFGVKSTTPTSAGELKTHFEFELFGVGVDAGQTTFRLRHAYGELGQIGAGQTWSPFMDPDVFPNSLEYWGPNGMVFFRNIQLRWMPLRGDNAVTIALERPGASGDQGLLSDRIELQGVKPRFDLPDLSGNVRFTRDWGHLQAAGMLRRIRWADTTDDQFDLGGNDIGWGVNLSSNVKVTGNDILRLQAVYGEGIENYMNDAPADVGVKRSNSANPLRPIIGAALPVLGIVSFLDHSWNKRFGSTIGYSFVNITNSEGQTPSAFHRGHYALTNLLFYPVENVILGGEFQWGRRENNGDGFAVNDYRIQFSFKYNFSKGWSF